MVIHLEDVKRENQKRLRQLAENPMFRDISIAGLGDQADITFDPFQINACELLYHICEII